MRAAVAWVLWALGLVSLVVAFVAPEEGASIWAMMTVILGGFAFGVVGLALILRTQSPIAWLLVGLQLSLGLSLIGFKGPEVMLIAAVLLVFPSGRLPSSRWRWAVYVLAIAGSLIGLDLVVEPDLGLGVFIIYVVMLAGGLRIINDYRKSPGDTRLQLKWLMWVLLLGLGLLVVSLIPIPLIDDAHELAGLVLTVGSPVAIGFAIARYRLYEIDRIISQTVSYTAIVLILGTVFAAGAVWTPPALGIEEPLAVAASTLMVAAAFNPLRRRVQSVVDRRFNRSKYDHERIAEEFSAALRDSVDLQQLLGGWIGVVTTTMHPRSIAVWTRVS